MSERRPAPHFDHRAFLATLTSRPGVYRMIGEGGRLLYVGKARNLKKRVASYFRSRQPSPRIRSMVAQIHDIEITVTHTEAEALILENNLIKEHRPRYNILLRDDKSYPWIFVSTDETFPRLAFHRGARSKGGRYFGPYPSAGAVRETLNLLQKLFRVRQCEDSFFRNRSRPCLQYQIDRCSAPCVGLVSEAEYRAEVGHAIRFLEGRSEELIGELVARMEQAAERLEFEQAARLRDRIEQLRRISDRQAISGELRDVDVLACAQEGGMTCVQVFTIRAGTVLGNRNFFPDNTEGLAPGEVLEAFLGQYYLERALPDELLLSHEPPERELLEQVFAERRGRRVRITSRVRKDRARWLELARNNAEQALAARIASRTGMQARLEALQEALDLPEPPQRLECFDISHTGGEATVAACVVFGPEGPLKSDYRRFNIRDIEPGDDYAAMRQALMRRYTRIKKGEGRLPDLLLIDGGRGQLRQAAEVLEELQVEGVTLLGITKGEGRRPELDSLRLSDRSEPTILPPDSPALHLLQQLRDEAHRFAITGHRQRRARKRRSSPLEGIEGLGPKRRQSLLKHFGGLQGVLRASREELAKVPGISRRLAGRIHETLHES